MLNRDALVELYRELQDEKVLSIYLDGRGSDPAERKVWRTELEHELSRIRETLDDDADREAFDAAVGHLQESIEGFGGFVPDRGWIGVGTADRVHYTEVVPVPMPTLARWEQGVRVAPYIRGLKQSRVVAAVLLDSRRARVFVYRDGRLVEPESLRADTFLGDLTDVNISKRATTHSGTRGKTGTDAAQRVLEVSSERMRKRLAEVVTDIVGDDGLLVVGGTPEMVSAAVREVPKTLRERVAERPSLHLEMSAHEVKEAVEEAASEVSRRLQSSLVDEVVNLARADGRGCLGRDETERALRERRVDTLVLARSFIRGDQDFADRCVGTAFEQHAKVEEVSGDADDRLLEAGEGIGARLRYRVPEGGRPPDEGEASGGGGAAAEGGEG